MRFPITCTVSHKWPHSHGALGHGSPASLQVHNNSNWAHSWTRRGARIRGVTESVSPTYTHTHTHTHTHTEEAWELEADQRSQRDINDSEQYIQNNTQQRSHDWQKHTRKRECSRFCVCMCAHMLTCMAVIYHLQKLSAVQRKKNAFTFPQPAHRKYRRQLLHTHTQTRVHTHTHTHTDCFEAEKLSSN